MKQHKIKDDLEEENEDLMRKIIVKYFHKTTLFWVFSNGIRSCMEYLITISSFPPGNHFQKSSNTYM